MGKAELQRSSQDWRTRGACRQPSVTTPPTFYAPEQLWIEMLCNPVSVRAEASMEANVGTSLQPWQIYSGLFLGFWAFSAFFDHFLATALLCLVFGAAGDQLTRYMYTLGSSMTGSGLDKGEVVTLLDMARQEASLVPSLTQMAKNEVSGKTTLHGGIVEEDEDEDDLPPPPVPARRDDIAERLGGVSDKLQQLTKEMGDGPTEL